MSQEKDTAVNASPVSSAMAEATALVRGARQDAYGRPENSLRAIALVWSGLLAGKLRNGHEVTGEDVALMMAGLKLARESNQRKRDNVVDAHGYLYMLELAAYARPDEALAAEAFSTTTAAAKEKSK